MVDLNVVIVVHMTESADAGESLQGRLLLLQG